MTTDPETQPPRPFETSIEGSASLLQAAARSAVRYTQEVDRRRVAPDAAALAGLDRFNEPLPEFGATPESTLALLDEFGSPATVATTGARYFGFVNGATLPVALGASFLANAWDQNAALAVMSPVAAALHETVRGWLVELLGLPSQTALSFVTGATVANAAALATARDTLLQQMGWETQSQGLFGAPPLNVVIGQQAHSTLRKSLGLVGLGRDRVLIVPADDQGRMRVDLLPDLSGPVLVCAQAGEVNTGAFDHFDPLADYVADHGGWLHVDGAFGLWALADPSRSDLVAGLTRADSWATDGHKWLNVTYDCGMAFFRDPTAPRQTFSAAAGYLPVSDTYDAMHNTPQSSQRARQVEVWAVLRTLGRTGLAELIGGTSLVAQRIAHLLAEGGFTILNDVVLNQVLVRPPDPTHTDALITAIQQDGRIWCGPTQWQGSSAMRISVSSWKTTLTDGEFAASVILELAAEVGRA